MTRCFKDRFGIRKFLQTAHLAIGVLKGVDIEEARHVTHTDGLLHVVGDDDDRVAVLELYCRNASHLALADNYSEFLKKHRRQLTRTNSTLASQYRAQHGRSYRDAQDAYMTRVYNYFALPPALPAFCDVAHQIGQEIVDVPAGQLHVFAQNPTDVF